MYLSVSARAHVAIFTPAVTRHGRAKVSQEARRGRVSLTTARNMRNSSHGDGSVERINQQEMMAADRRSNTVASSVMRQLRCQLSPYLSWRCCGSTLSSGLGTSRSNTHTARVSNTLEKLPAFFPRFFIFLFLQTEAWRRCFHSGLKMRSLRLRFHSRIFLLSWCFSFFVQPKVSINQANYGSVDGCSSGDWS